MMAIRTLLLLSGIPLSIAACSDVLAQSTCYGTPANGAIEGSVRLNESGANFERYRWKEGEKRTFVHSAVKSVLEDAFDAMYKARPEVKLLIGETGLEGGGILSGHVTHRNGTSVDLFVPVKDAVDNASILFPNDYRNGYGYKVRFDAVGKSLDGKLDIDFDALAEYIYQNFGVRQEERAGCAAGHLGQRVPAEIVRYTSRLVLALERSLFR